MNIYGLMVNNRNLNDLITLSVVFQRQDTELDKLFRMSNEATNIMYETNKDELYELLKQFDKQYYGERSTILHKKVFNGKRDRGFAFKTKKDINKLKTDEKSWPFALFKAQELEIENLFKYTLCVMRKTINNNIKPSEDKYSYTIPHKFLYSQGLNYLDEYDCTNIVYYRDFYCHTHRTEREERKINNQRLFLISEEDRIDFSRLMKEISFNNGKGYE